LDISFVKDSTDACACMSVLARESLEPIAHVIKRVTMTVPYIPGYLAFREAPLLLGLVSTWQSVVAAGLPESVVEELSARKPSRKGLVKDGCSFETDDKFEVHLVGGWRSRVSGLSGAGTAAEPSHACRALPELPAVDVLLVDGNGYHHPRRCGAAVAVGVECGLPTIGIGKELHAFAQLQRDEVAARAMAGLKKQGQWMLLHCPVHEPGSAAASTGSSWEVTGAAMRSGKSAKKPIYVSVGNRMSLRNACAVTASLVRHRVPEPVRQADLFSRQWLRDQEAEAAALEASEA
jgi:deoxyinosine 3'endonuclease (endonuclease V)